MIVFFIGAVLAVLIFHLFVFHQYNFPWTARLINKIPGPDGVFYFGSTMRFWNLKNEDRIENFCNMFREYGSTYRLWFSGVPTVFISELDDFQTVLGNRDNSSKGIMYRHLLPWLGRGLLTSSGSKWHTRRKIITPTFHFSILQGFVQIFNRNTKVMIEKLMETNRNEVELSSYVTRCTLDNVCETAMGVSSESHTTEHNSYVSAVFRMGAILAERMFSPLLFPDLNFAMSEVGKEHNLLLKSLHGFTEKVIRKCKQSTVSKSVQKESPQDGIYQNKLTFLKLLLEKQKEYGLSDKDIREEVDTFMFEGHDTTSMGITWTLFELGCHPDIQTTCYQEQENIFGGSERPTSYQDVMQMGYLKRVIQESLRLHPSVPIISRKFDIDMQLKDYMIPANTEIIMNIYNLHRNPQVYKDPLKFDPDRFLPENVENRHRFAYVPFSAGLRNCVGQKFAMLELLITVSSIIRHFQIMTLNDRMATKVVPEMTLRPACKLYWAITPRK